MLLKPDLQTLEQTLAEASSDVTTMAMYETRHKRSKHIQNRRLMVSNHRHQVADERHPEHIRGNGPEQDYLSRYFARDWRHIDVAYNFQLHQMYYAPGQRTVNIG